MTCPVMESRIWSTSRDSLSFWESPRPFGERRRALAALLRDGVFCRVARVDQSKPQIGLAYDSHRICPFPRRPQNPARVDIEGEPPGPRLAEFLSRRHPDRLWRFRR